MYNEIGYIEQIIYPHQFPWSRYHIWLYWSLVW